VVNEKYFLSFIVSNMGAKTGALMDINAPPGFDVGKTEFNFTIGSGETKILNAG
jgi:hypothetical protein